MDGAPDIDEPRGGVSGCLIPLIAFAMLAIAGFAWLKWNAPRGHLPREVRIVEVLEFNSAGFFREGCAYGVYRLDPATAARLRSEGIDFLMTSGRAPKTNPHNPYGPWQSTPLALHARQLPLGATACGRDRLSATEQERARKLERALAATGSYFAVTQNREGLLVIDPRRELAWFLYAG